MSKNTKLSSFTDEELEKEIEKRKKPLQEKPVPLLKMNWIPLTNLIKEHIDSVGEVGESKDVKQWIYELAMETVYGETVWRWINSHIK